MVYVAGVDSKWLVETCQATVATVATMATVATWGRSAQMPGGAILGCLE